MRRTLSVPALMLRAAAWLAPAPRKAQLGRIGDAFETGAAPPQVIIATPHRFLRPDKLARRQGAYANLLNVIETAATRCRDRGLVAGFMLSERLASTPASVRLVLSHHTLDGPVFQALSARGVVVRHFKTGDLPGTTIFDPTGFSGWSSLSGRKVCTLDLHGADPAQIDGFYDSARAAILQGGVTKYAQNAVSEPPLPARYVFVALQTIGDMVQRLAYLPMLDMLRMVVETYAGSGITVVVKRHPKCRSRAVAQALRDLSARHGHLRLSARPIHELLAGALALFAVNSGVGSEAMIHGTPVYLFGRADYDAIAHQIRSADDLRRLALPPRPAVDAAALRAFHFYYRTRHQAQGPAALTARIDALLDEGFGPAQGNSAPASG